MINPKHSYNQSADNTTMPWEQKNSWHVNTFLCFVKTNHTFRWSQKIVGNEHICNMLIKIHETVQWITKTKLSILLYRRSVNPMGCLQYPEQTTSTPSRSGTKQITEGRCNQPATAAYPNNVNYIREYGDPLKRSFIPWTPLTWPLKWPVLFCGWKNHFSCPPWLDQMRTESNLFTFYMSICGKLGATCHNTSTKIQRNIKCRVTYFDAKYLLLPLVYTWHIAADGTYQTST